MLVRSLPRPIASVASLASTVLLALVALPVTGPAQSPTSATSAATPPARSTQPAAPPVSAASALEQFAPLGLTAAQRTTIDSLASAARAAREALLAKRTGSPPSAQPAGVASGASAGGPAIGLSFTEAERVELQRIGSEYEAGLRRVLTAAQWGKLTAAREALRERHQAAAEAAAKAAHANRPTQPPADLKPAPATPPAPAAPPASRTP